tara:strand:- start:117 stop:1157 length:1041 start_codon:yes stop_codon:yes gene_type:complete
MAYTTIDDPSVYFQTAIYAGNGSAGTSITNDGNSDLQPDWLWIKNRSNTVNHGIWDSSRGSGKRLTLGTGAEEDQTNVASFNSDGFTVNTGDIVNTNSHTYVAWQWKANGGTTASNTNGTITSTVQANTDAGFSIIKYDGNGTDGATIGHGLSQTPQIFFPKCLSTTTNWEMYYFPTGGTRQFGYLNLTNGLNTWSHNAPSSTIISLSGSGDSNGNGRSMIGYAFHSVQGYSKIGQYSGNGNADGVFVYTGFKPAWLMTKRIDSSDHWRIVDSTREPFNDGSMQGLKANTDEAEADAGSRGLDFLSNGFKIRTTDPDSNASGGNYLYMCFASYPLVSSDGVPVTAR